MANDGNTFSVLSIGNLKRFGVRLEHFSAMADSIHRELATVVDKYPDPGGDGDVGKSFKVNYDPVASAVLEFLGGLTTLLGGHGSAVSYLGGLFDDVNNTATDSVGDTHGGKR